MKTISLFIVFVMFGLPSLRAQTIDYNKIILPDRAQSSDFGEKLVQLAWKNHPTNEILRRELMIAQYQVGRSAADWLDLITIQGNINEFNIKAQDAAVPVFLPRYNFGISIPLGVLVANPNETKQNRQRLSIAQEEINAQKLEVRRVVLKSYNEYQLREKIFRIQSQQFSDIESNFKLIEQRFKNGELTFETFTAGQSDLNRASIQLLEAERDLKNAKLDLEQLIGVRLEDVM
ncbi:MAG: TolC family protein [Cyclobacteriaceae bacterium]|nr:MAG: TolC family protein [Cyclobacteriaceae bacterium]